MSGQLKEVRERIKSVKSTQQITKAMKMVSAAKLRRAQDAIVKMRPYADRLNKMIKNILSNLGSDADTSFGEDREVLNMLLVVVTSSKGLCGAFNTNILKSAVATLNDNQELVNAGKVSVLCIGKKGNDFFRRNYKNINRITDHVDAFSDLSFDNISHISQTVMDQFEAKEYDRVLVAYGRFKNAALQFPEVATFLPVEKVEVSDEEGDKYKADYVFEPGKQELLEQLVPSILQTTFRKYLLDTHASEHGARMTAMDNATENAEELVKDLKISYNKARQEAITKELSEIVGGAAALGG